MKNETKAYKGCLWSLVAAAGLMVLLFLTSCKHTEYVTVERVKTDTTYINKVQRDSVLLHDSIHVKEKGDTVWIERWHTRWENHLTHDTLYQYRVDSVPVPYPVPEYIEKQLTWWQQTRLHIANVMMYLLGLGALFLWVKRYLRL